MFADCDCKFAIPYLNYTLIRNESRHEHVEHMTCVLKKNLEITGLL